MKGFLPSYNPLKEYSDSSSVHLNRLQEIAKSLPKLLLTGRVPKTIKSLKKNDLSIDHLLEEKLTKDIRLAMVHLSFIAHSLVWGGQKPIEKIPEVIAKPWVKVAKFLKRPPVLSYASYCLDNWYLLEKEAICLENVGLINNFLGGVDEDLSLIHI